MRDLILHLRLPFSVFLMPVFWFALSQIPHCDPTHLIVLFAVLHLLVYPSSNGYNSYMDNDTGSIGGIKTPPKVPKAMFWVSVSMDCLALLFIGVFFSWHIIVLLLLYITASRAYSYRGIRLKKYPILGFLTVAICQGCLVFSLVYIALLGNATLHFSFILSNFIAFLLIGAGYPLTQIYQHTQDRDDNVQTLSMLLGIRGTFIFSGILFALLGASLTTYFVLFGNGYADLLLLAVCLLPVAYYFATWAFACFKNTANANFERTMRMNVIGSVALNAFFILLLLKNYL
jgi:1,4-dihydroxy-2-naphthoate polyprenyltransferase